MKKQARGLGKRVEAIVHCSMGCLAQKLEPLGGEKMGHYDISRLLCLAQVLEEVEKKKKQQGTGIESHMNLHHSYPLF